MSAPYNGYSPYPLYYHPSPSEVSPQQDSYMSGFGQRAPVPPEFAAQPYTPIEEYSSAYGAPQTGSRARRRVGVGGAHVKHRRTRSGCYTCRNRRVKCDEMRPICERCQKGARECVYPEPTSSSKMKRRDSKDTKHGHAESDLSTSGDEGEVAPGEESETAPSHSAQDAESSSGVEELRLSRPTGSRQSSFTTSSTQARSPTALATKPTPGRLHAAETSASPSGGYGRQSQVIAPPPGQGGRFGDLSPDVRFYVNFFLTRLNKYHYFLKFDDDDYLHTTFLDLALSSDPLLYAVVCFSAYHYSVTRKGGKIQDFLGYYNKSVTMLRLSLTKQHKPTVATLMTVLQLATIEEYLGDWVSLLSHQRAAFEIISALYSPQTAMQTVTSRTVLGWYLRFDLTGGLISGSGTFLSREWFQANRNHHQRVARQRPTDLAALYSDRYSEICLICADAASLWASRGRDGLTDQDFNSRLDDMEARVARFEGDIPPLILDPSKFVRDFSDAPPRDPDDIVDPYDPAFLYDEPLWSSNLILLDWWASEMMFKHQLATMRRQPPPPDVFGLAMKMLKMFEAIELSPRAPPAMIIAAQASLGVACLFVPNDHRHSMWVRRKLAVVEASGFTYPKTFRDRLSEHFGVDLSHWWLPDDEGFPPILHAIRSLIHDRSEGPQRDQMSADIRDMRGFFDKLALAEDAPAESPSSVTAQLQPEDKGKSRSSSVQLPRGGGGGADFQMESMGNL